MGDLVEADAMRLDDVNRLIEHGQSRWERRLADHGLICLGEVGIGNTTVAAALSCALLGLAPESSVGLGASADTAMIERKRDVVAAPSPGRAPTTGTT